MRIIRRVIPGWGRTRTAAVIGAVAAAGLAIGLPLGLAPSGHAKAGVSPGASAPGSGDGLAPRSGSGSTVAGPTTSTTSTSATKVSVVPSVAYAGVPSESPSGGVVVDTPAAVPKAGSPAANGPAATTVPGRNQAVWTQQTLPGGTAKLLAVSCPDASACWSVGDGGVVATTDGGGRWTAQPTPTLHSADYLDGVSCVDGRTCWATSRAGRMFHTIDGGRTWSDEQVTAPGGESGFYGISCVDGSHCMAAGAGSGWLASTSDGGSTWTTSSACDTCNLLSISCVSATTCWAGGTESPGPSGSRPNVPVIYATRDGGATWTGQVTLPSTDGATGAVRSISCSTAAECTAVGDYTGTPSLILSTTDGGIDWTRSNPPAGVTGLTAVSCVASAACWATGSSGSGAAVITRASVGAPWAQDEHSASVTFQAISCLGTGQCWAAGSLLTNPGEPTPGAIFARTEP